MIKNLNKKPEKYKFLHEFLVGVQNHSLRKRNDERSSADVLYVVWHKSQFAPHAQ